MDDTSVTWGLVVWYSLTLLVTVAFVATVTAFVADVYENKDLKARAEAVALMGWAGVIIALLGSVIGWMWLNPILK